MKKYFIFVAIIFSSVLFAGGNGCSSGTSAESPTVTSTVPDPFAIGVPLNWKMAAAFSTMMDPETIDTSTFILNLGADGGPSVSGTIAYDVTNDIAIFTPSDVLEPNALYSVTITTGAKSLEAVPMANAFVWSFETGATIDATPPVVSSTSPANGSDNAPVDGKIAATFDKPMDPRTITESSFTLTGPGGNPVIGIVTYSGTSAVFEPSAELAHYSSYTATVTTETRDIAGNALAENYAWTFSTDSGPSPVIVPPRVISTDPANGSTGTAIDARIHANFNTTMNPATLTTATFLLTGPRNVAVTGTVSSSGATATFTPLSRLSYGVEYSVTITTGAQDLDGNSLESAYVWSFTTQPKDYTAWVDQGIVFAPGGNAYYPSVIYDSDGFGVGAAPFAMWYSDGSGRVFVARSSDGVTWSAPTTINGLADSAHHVQVLYDANCFGKLPCDAGTAKYRIWYWDISAPTIYDITSIATAESADGVNWTNVSAISQNAAAQLVVDNGTNWNRGTYGPVFLFYWADAANSGSEPWDYGYVMYYDGTDGSHEDTGLAYSADGMLWSAYSTSDPVLGGSAAAAWDCTGAAYGTIFRDEAGFHYWYSGGGGDNGSGGCADGPINQGIGYAFSSDGKTWEKNADNPIFDITDNVSYRTLRVYTPSVVDDGTGVFKMYYTAVGSDGVKKIAMAVLP